MSERETVRIEDQIRRSIQGDSWHGPAILEVLDGLTVEQASARPVSAAHTVWELVLHLTATYELVLRRLHGEPPHMPRVDWPEVPPPSESAWSAAVEALVATDAQMRGEILRFPSDRLDEPLVADPPYSAYVQFIGLAEHNLYHAGQMILLKRAL